MIQLFEEFTKKRVCTFDLDGTIHKSVIGPHPTDPWEPELWEPNREMIDKMKEEAKTADVYIVTARDDNSYNRAAINKFIEMHDLPVKKVYYTDNRPKLPTLIKLGSMRHYDDVPHPELKPAGIEFVQIKN